MKGLKWIFLAAGVFAMLCLISGCKKGVQFQTAFPLDEETVTAALEKTGLPGELSESETTSNGEGHILHVVRSPTETYSDTISPEEARADPPSRALIAGVDSIIFEGERKLSATFDQIEVPERFAWEDWKRQIVFATLLYGGFEDEEAVYQAFLNQEVPEIKNAVSKNAAGEYSFEWEARLPGGYCRIRYSTRKGHTIMNEYGEPAGKRRSGTMLVQIYESEALYQKMRQEAAEIKAKQEAARLAAQD